MLNTPPRGPSRKHAMLSRSRVRGRRNRVLQAGVLVAASCLLAGCGTDGYPDDWASPNGMLAARKGWSCPNLEGDYDDVSYELLRMLGTGSSVDRWHDHHARITQADDGSWLRIEPALNARGMRAVRGEQAKGERAYAGRGSAVTIRYGDHFTCSNGWLYSLARQQVEVDGTKYEELRFGLDKGGALIAGTKTAFEETIGWGDASASMGESSRMHWRRWEVRDVADIDAVTALEGVRLQRGHWMNGSRVPVFFGNFQGRPVCARLVQPWRTSNEKPVVSRADETTRTDDTGKPWGCPADSGTMDALATTHWDVWPPEPDGSFGEPRVEWQSVDHLDEPWHIVPITDARTLPVRRR